MTFPVWIDVFGVRLHPHPVFEVSAFASAWLVQRAFRSRNAPVFRNGWIWIGALFGALLGAKLLHWLENLPALIASDAGWAAWYGGKTVLGALIGGWAGVEVCKRLTRQPEASGVGLVYALLAAIVVGRVGCFLTGLSDGTCGKPTSVAWAVDFGDGPRHPTQLYEIGFLLVFGVALVIVRRVPWWALPGEPFRAFMLAYAAWRVAVEFFKPRVWTPGGLSPIQWVALGMIPIVLHSWLRLRSTIESTVPGGLQA